MTFPKKIPKTIESLESGLARKITDVSGSMTFVYLHIIWFGVWVVINNGFVRKFILPFDPFPYGLLTMIVSLEAIFLSAFIMVAQNRQALLDEYRDIEETLEEKEEEKDINDIQKDLRDLKKSLELIQKKMSLLEKVRR